ncbi:hypothetical protein SCLCIDRAFT_789272 [Scleroderma citrinum Foug A]|uniref:Uncharacterized protein n=1 Tax=Scleroderma citrinum Foug A TaxID=1036808 RepID=A0A0C2ZMB4_9AGAM|nr:hypothetical protein SCLCIDRAFT_789272 [Scleroderma citrinum Foug A]
MGTTKAMTRSIETTRTITADDGDDDDDSPTSVITTTSSIMRTAITEYQYHHNHYHCTAMMTAARELFCLNIFQRILTFSGSFIAILVLFNTCDTSLHSLHLCVRSPVPFDSSVGPLVSLICSYAS